MLQAQGQELAGTVGGLGKPPCSETQVKPQLCFHLKAAHP